MDFRNWGIPGGTRPGPGRGWIPGGGTGSAGIWKNRLPGRDLRLRYAAADRRYCGLVEALGEKSAIVVGHDFGAAVAQYCALLRPDIFRAVVLLSIPYTPGDGEKFHRPG